MAARGGVRVKTSCGGRVRTISRASMRLAVAVLGVVLYGTARTAAADRATPRLDAGFIPSSNCPPRLCLHLRGGRGAVAVATWDFGRIAVTEAAKYLQTGKSAVDAAEAGVQAVELDNSAQYYVGYGGLPNSMGCMELDAAIMSAAPPTPAGARGPTRLGAVCALPLHRRRNEMRVVGLGSAISVARAVMDKSPHNVLVGEGALDFARQCGIEIHDSLSPEAQAEYGRWKQSQCDLKQCELIQDNIDPMSVRGSETHDTVGIICMDEDGGLCAATSTSGWPYKHPGRVGDSPLVGSGLFVDPSVGAAVATGDGEDIMRTCLSFLVVERMRAGDSPTDACEAGIARLREYCAGSEQGKKMHKTLTVGVLALSISGQIGVSSTLGPHNPHRGRESFPCAVWRQDDQAHHTVYGAETQNTI